MTTGRGRRRLVPPLLFLLFLVGLGVVVGRWQLGSGLAPTVPAARAATGACEPALSSLVTDSLSVSAGGPGATLTATCTSLEGQVAGRRISLRQTGGLSEITPAVAVTNSHGVAQFKVTGFRAAGPITYTAVAQAAGGAFDQTVQVRFLAAHTTFAPVPIAMVGLLGMSGMGALVLVFLQMRRRRRSSAKVRVRHVC